MKKIYFVGNAHLDPVWLWRWQEGSAEAKATVRSALDRMREYPDFKFVCSSASVYKWIEDFDPNMFREIRERVREGRFIIVGGWHVQPDCNLPSGEGFVRQGLYSQRWFYDKFGVIAEVGYNVDSFGHNLMLPEILKKSGMKYYVFMRPGPHEMELPPVFIWRSPDGSEIPSYRIYERYNHNLTSAEELCDKLSSLEEYLGDKDSGMFFYGVGNHGGGPTKKNIELILNGSGKDGEREYVFSDITDYFDELMTSAEQLPVHCDDLQHHASGCYSAVSAVKDLIRKSENALLSAETVNVLAATLTGRKYETAELHRGWENVLFCHFHDVAGGCCIEHAYSDASYMLGESISIAEKIKNSAQQTISWAIDASDVNKGCPIVIFNSLPFEINHIVRINKEVKCIYSPNGSRVLLQNVHSYAYSTHGRRDTIFEARVPAMGYATYYIRNEESIEYESALGISESGLENEYIRVHIDGATGHITSIFDKQRGIEMLSGKGAVPVVIDERGHDTWSHAKNYFTNEIGCFADASVRILEAGPVRVALEVVSRYNNSTLKQIFSLSEGTRRLDVSAEVDWHEEHKMLKIAYATATELPKAYYEIPFGVIERPANGEEEPGYRWVALGDGEHAYAILNSNKYSHSANGNTLYLTVVRSPLYVDHGRPENDRCNFTDQGAHKFEYAFMPTDTEHLAELIKEARKLGTPPELIIENNHNGYLETDFCGISCNADNIQISAIKRAEDGCGTVIRFYETDGTCADVCIGGALLKKELHAKVTPYSTVTYYLSDTESEWKEVLMTEFDI